MRFLTKLVSFLLAGGLVSGVAQGSLTGSNVTGSIFFNGGSTNFFNSANNFVPATGFLNSGGATTVTISTTVPEFGYQDTANAIRADFGSSTLLINDTAVTAGGLVATQFQFTDPAFAGLAVTESSDTFPGGMSVSLVGSTITINYAGTAISGTYNTVYTIAPAVPEPASLAICAFAPLMMGRRRQSASGI
jgi:hypothetical protein